MFYLYHGTTSVCSAKVRVGLAEKGVAWDGEVIDLGRGDQHRPDYVKLNPNEVVPTLVDGDHVIIESTLILEYIEESAPEHPLMPADPYGRAMVRLWMKKIDDYLHPSCSTVTFATVMRRVLLQKSPEDLAAHFAKIPDPAYRERQRLAVAEGLAAPHVAPAIRNYDKYVREMEAALAKSPYLVGGEYTMADAAATPYLNRALLVGLDLFWTDGRLPRVEDWFARMRARASFNEAIDAWMSDKDRARYDIPHDETRAAVRQILAFD